MVLLIHPGNASLKSKNLDSGELATHTRNVRDVQEVSTVDTFLDLIRLFSNKTVKGYYIFIFVEKHTNFHFQEHVPSKYCAGDNATSPNRLHAE